MALKDDILIVINQIGTNLVGNIKEEYGQAATDSYTVGTMQPLIKFYNDNEQELTSKYGISLNELLGMNQNLQNNLDKYGTVKPPINNNTLESNDNRTYEDNSVVEYALPILGIIAGGAAILIIIKTLKK